MSIKDVEFRAAFEIATFDFFKQCVENGANPEQAIKEMKANEELIAERIRELLK